LSTHSTKQTGKPPSKPEPATEVEPASRATHGPARTVAYGEREDASSIAGEGEGPGDGSGGNGNGNGNGNGGPTVDQNVEKFNMMGYEQTFAAVAEALGVDPVALYNLYESREALGETWLREVVPQSASQPSVREMFSGCVFALLRALQERRDFSRAWLAAVRVSGPLHLRQLHELHDTLRQYFIGWLDANQGLISLPRRMHVDDVVSELADALCGLTMFMVTAWEADRSKQYQDTWTLVDSTACVLDALLTSRPDLGDAGLLTHLTRIIGVPHGQFVEPLLDSLLKPERAQRLTIVQLIEGLRTLRFPTGSAS